MPITWKWHTYMKTCTQQPLIHSRTHTANIRIEMQSNWTPVCMCFTIWVLLHLITNWFCSFFLHFVSSLVFLLLLVVLYSGNDNSVASSIYVENNISQSILLNNWSLSHICIQCIFISFIISRWNSRAIKLQAATVVFVVLLLLLPPIHYTIFIVKRARVRENAGANIEIKKSVGILRARMSSRASE